MPTPSLTVPILLRVLCVGLLLAASVAPAHAHRTHADVPVESAASTPVPIEGKLARFFINPFGRVDLMQLDDGALICLPPGLGERAPQFVRPGERVRALVAPQKRPGEPHARALVNVESGRSLLDSEDPLPEPAPSLDPLRAEGKIDRLLGSPRRPRGALLADGTVVRFSPRFVHRHRALLQVGATIRVDGVGTRNERGVAIEAFSLERLPD